MPLRLLSVLLAALLPALAPAASFSEATPPASVSKTYKGVPFQFGYLTVPEDHANPFGKTIQLAVVILKAKQSGAGLPVFFLTGGPGGSATEDGIYFEVFTQLQQQHDVVLVDQRGTGWSSPFLGVTTRTYAEAKANFEGQGIDLGAYNTTQNAADIADLRVALGYSQVILFGNSYGTFLTQEVMRNHPAGIAAVIVDGVLPPTDTFIPNFNRNTLHGLNELFKDVGKTVAARRAFPHFSRTYYKLLKRLKHGKVRFPSGLEISLDDFQGIIEALLQSPERIRGIPLLVTEIAARRESPWLSHYFTSSVGGVRDFADGMYLSTLGTDWNQPDWLTLTRKANAALRPALFRQVNALSSLAVVYAVADWDVPYNPLDTRTPLVASIPTLLLAGQMEAQTPPDGAAIVAEGLGNSYYLFFPRSGHITGFTKGPALSALLQFAKDPSTRPVYSLASLKRKNFYLTKVPTAYERDSGQERPIKFMW